MEKSFFLSLVATPTILEAPALAAKLAAQEQIHAFAQNNAQKQEVLPPASFINTCIDVFYDMDAPCK